MTLPAGYAVRPASQDDVDAIVAVGNAYDVADFGRPDTAREHVLDGFRVPGFDAGDDSWLVLDRRGNPVAFGLVETEAIRVIGAFGRVHPEHWGRGIGTFLVDAMETRAARIARDGAEDRVVHNGVTSTDAAARRLLDDRGYGLVRFFWHMERSLRRADVRIVPDVSAFDIRVAQDEDELRATRGVLDEAFRGHWMTQPWAFEDWRRHVAEASVSVLIASVGAEVAGAVTWSSTSAGGWIEELGVRELYRGRGLGAFLLRHAFARLADGRVREVRLNVDAQNATGATRLYERVGMRVRREWLIYEKPVTRARLGSRPRRAS